MDMDSLLGNIGKLNEETHDKNEIQIDELDNQDQILENYSLDLQEELDFETEEFLKIQTVKIHNTVSKAYTELGKVFLETQEKLANNKTGVFEKWYVALGFPKRTVYRYIDRYKLIISCQNGTIKNLVESLPLSLSYEVAKESCPEDLKNMVLNGEIKTLKEFKEYKVLVEEENSNEPKHAEIVVDSEVLIQKIKTLNKTKKYISEKIEKLEEEKKELLYKEIEKFEKKIEKILK